MIDLRRRTTYFFLLVSLGHVLLISAQVQSKSGTPLLTHLTFGAFAGVQRAAAWAADGVGGVWRRYVALRGVEAENTALKTQLAVLEGQVQAQAALAGRTAALESALQLQPTLVQRTLAARVIAGDPVPGARVVTIDRGTSDGVRAEMGVIAVGGVVGRVMGQPAAHAAQVQLLTSRLAAAGAVLEQAQAEGVVAGGDGEPVLRMQYVLNSYDVTPGERVLTSGHDGIFPAGFVVGTVDRAERGTMMYKPIAIRPAVNFARLDIVLVLLDPPPAAASDAGPGRGGRP